MEDTRAQLFPCLPWRRASSVHTRIAIVATLFGVFFSTAEAATPLSLLRYSPDITVALGATTVRPQDVAEDRLAGIVSLANIGALPAGSHVSAYHVLPNGDQLVSFDMSVALPGGLTARPGDVVRFDGTTYSIEFDATAATVPMGVIADAVSVVTGGDLLLSFDTTITALGAVADKEDLVRFDRQLRSFSLFFDGSAAGVPAGLNLDGAQYLESNGHLLLSFDGSGTVGRVTFDDEDVLEYDLSSNAPWELAYDGSAQHLGWAPADLDGLWAVTCPQNKIDGALPLSAAGSTSFLPNSLAGTCGGSDAAEATLLFIAPDTDTYTFDTFGSAFDTVLYLRDIACSGTELRGGCNDDAGSGATWSQVAASLSAGQNVIIVVDGSGTASGSYTLHVNVATRTATPTSTPSHTPSPSRTATHSHTATRTDTAAPTPTRTPTPTSIPTLTVTVSPSPSGTRTSTPSPTPTLTLTRTTTPTSTGRPTGTPTDSPRPSSSPTPSATARGTATPTPGEAPTSTATPTSARTATPSATPVSPPTFLAGDANCDGRVTVADLPALLVVIAEGGIGPCGADADCDGDVNGTDLTVLVTGLFSGLAPAPCGT